MKKIFTKFSLLFIGLMLCAGNAWAADGYNNETGTSGTGYYQQTGANGVVYRVDYTYTIQETLLNPNVPSMVQRTTNRTPITITSCNNHEDDYKYKGAHAYVVGEYSGNTALTFVNSITMNTAEVTFMGNPMGNPITTTVPVCLKKSNFNNYSGKITLPAYPADGKAIVYEGWSVRDERYTDANFGDPFTYVFGANATVEAPKLSDRAKYNAQRVDYFGTYLNSSSSAYMHGSTPKAYPWNGHLTNGTASESYDVLDSDEDENWVLYANGILIVAYDGAMPDFSDGSSPWYSNRDKIYAVKIASSVTSIGAYAFQGCENLSEVIFLGDDVTSFGQYCFQECDMLQKFDVPSGVTTLATEIFNGCDYLVEVNLPASVSTMAESVFDATHVLNAVTILNDSPNAETIHSGAFNSVSTVIIPDAAACDYINLHNESTWTSKVFKSVTTGDELECDEEPEEPEEPSVNYSCGANLTWSFADGTLTITGTGAMTDYASANELPWVAGNVAAQTDITSVVLPSGMTTIGNNAFGGCTNLTSVVLPSSLTAIGAYAFAYCTGLTSIVIPSSVETIGVGAFGYSGLTAVTIPSSVTSIGAQAFVMSANLKTVTVLNETPCTLGDNAFITSMQMVQDGWSYNVQYACDVETFYVPEGTKTTYLANASWAAYMNNDNTKEVVAFADGENTTSKLTNGDHDMLIINRNVQRNGYLNTLCLPFSMNETQIANSSLNGAVIYEFSGVTQVNSDFELTLTPVSTIEAGKPYFFKYEMSEPMLTQLIFRDVIVSTNETQDVTFENFTLKGTLSTQEVEAVMDFYTSTYTIIYSLGAENTLYCITSGIQTVYPLRAYFEYNFSMISFAPAARISFGRNTATDVENVQKNAQSTKIIEDGQVVIIRNGARYNVAGQVIK